MACFYHHSETALLRTSRDESPARTFAEPGVTPNYAPSRAVKITHVDIQLDLYPTERRFTGSSRLHLRALPSYRGRFALDLDDVAVESVTDGEGGEVSWSHDGPQLVVHAESPPAELVVVWSAQDSRRGMYYTGATPSQTDRLPMAWTQCQDEDGHFVFPCHDHPRFKHSWHITLTGPAGDTLLSNGRLVEEGERQGRAYAVYEQVEPMPAYLFSAISAKLTTVDAEWRGRPVRYHVPEGREEPIIRSMGKTPAMIELYSTTTGVDYPWPRYDQVVVDDFVFGGMENVACTTMTDLLLVDEMASLEWDPDALVSHELAHQWFGDLVTCQDWSQSWLNESWATFMEGVWWEHDRTVAEASWYRFTMAREYLEEDEGRYRRPIVSYDFRQPIDVFDRHLYQKGGCVLMTLRTILGDQAFWGGVKGYLTRHANDTVHSRHFQRAIEDYTGVNLDQFFTQWIHGAGHPELEITLGEGKGLVTVKVTQTQKGDQTETAFAFPLHVEIVGADGSIQAVDLPVEDQTRAWAIPFAGQVKTVRVDPDFRILATIALEAPRGWLVALLDDACPVLAHRAAKALLTKGSHAGFRAVVEAMGRHGNWELRADLCDQVGSSGSSEARDALLAVLKSEDDPRVRRAACTALGSFRQAVVADALIGVIEADVETWHLTGEALLALGKTRDPRAPELLESHLDTSCWGDLLRHKALAGLAQTRDAAVLDTLLGYTHTDWPERTRAAAAVALGSLGDHVEKVRDPAMERLVEMLDEPGFRSLVGAIDGLGRLRHAGSIGALERMHRSGGDGRARRLAYEALNKVRAGRTAEQGLAVLRKKIDALEKTNGELNLRLGKVESQVTPPE